MLKRSGLFSSNLKGCVISRACTAEDLKQAYRLVHDIYVGSGFISADPSGMRLRIFETAAETATFIAKVDGRVVGVLSVVEDSPELGLPSDCVFKDELDGMRRAGRRLCEVTNQAVADDYRKSGVPTELMRCAIAVALSRGCHEAVAAVSPSHNGFYDLLAFRQVGLQRSYSKTIDDPVIAVSMDVDQYRATHAIRDELRPTERFIHEFLTDTNQFISRMNAWAHEARKHFLNAHLLRQLFVTEKNLLRTLSVNQLSLLRQRWGHEIFAAVTAGLFVKLPPLTTTHARGSVGLVATFRFLPRTPVASARAHHRSLRRPSRSARRFRTLYGVTRPRAGINR